MADTLSALDQPFDEATRFLRQKAAVPTRSWRDVWDGAHSKMFMVAGANKQALVDDLQAEIAKALEKGTTLEEFRAGFDQVVKKHGWSYRGERGWRTRTIFETNLRTAYAAGRYAKLTEPDTLRNFPFWQYNHSGALHPRVQHLAWDGKVYPADDAFWSVAYPPNGFGCGCYVTPVSRPGLRRLGKAAPDEAPDLDQLGTDQPLGVDPSFACNPGMSWLTQTAPGPNPVTATEFQVAGFIKSSLKGKWPDGSWTPLGKVAKADASSLNVPAGTEIRLQAETVRTGRQLIGDAAETFGAAAIRTVKTGRLLLSKTGQHFYVAEVDGKLYQAAVEPGTVGRGKQVLLTDFREVSAGSLTRQFGKGWK